jgi:phosphinothricin acetyltransferase
MLPRRWVMKSRASLALEALCDEAERLGFLKLVSRIFPENQASLALDQKGGFREVGVYRRHGKLAGERRDRVIVRSCWAKPPNSELARLIDGRDRQH